MSYHSQPASLLIKRVVSTWLSLDFPLVGRLLVVAYGALMLMASVDWLQGICVPQSMVSSSTMAACTFPKVGIPAVLAGLNWMGDRRFFSIICRVRVTIIRTPLP